jgi:galactose mutarotase-like enzyme
MITLNNGLWGARIAGMGAEMKSLMDLSSGQEYVWNGDPAWWNGSAPILFPVIGGLKAGEYSYEGKSYTLPSHGFARGRSSPLPARKGNLVKARRPVPLHRALAWDSRHE